MISWWQPAAVRLPRRGTGENGTEAGKEKKQNGGTRGPARGPTLSDTPRPARGARRAAPGFPGQRAAGPWGTWPAGPARDPHTATSATPPPSPRRTATSSARRPMRIRRPSLGWLVRPPTCGHRQLGMFVVLPLFDFATKLACTFLERRISHA